MDCGALGAVLFFTAFFAFLLLIQLEEAESHQTILWIISLMLIVAAVLLFAGIIFESLNMALVIAISFNPG